MNFRQLTQQDIDWMRENTGDKAFWKSLPERVDYDYCLEHCGDVLCAGGVRLMNETTAVGWIDISPKGHEHIVLCYRTISEWMIQLCQSIGIIRLEAYVREGFGAGVRTVEHLGFSFERKVPRYFGNTDAMLFVRFFEQESK